MPRRITLDQEMLARVRKEDAAINASLTALEKRKIPCKYCKCLTITKFEDLEKGHFIAFCTRCGQVGTYEAADYRHYSYIAHPEATATFLKHYA